MPRLTTLPPRCHADLATHVAAQFRQARFTQQDYLRDWALHRAIDQAPQVTCAQFRQKAKQRGWSDPWLAEQIRGEVDRPAEVIKRLMSLAPGTTVIPYTPLLALYDGTARQAAVQPGQRPCRCGCQKAVRGRQVWATAGCRKRVQRASETSRKVAV